MSDGYFIISPQIISSSIISMYSVSGIAVQNFGTFQRRQFCTIDMKQIDMTELTAQVNELSLRLVALDATPFLLLEREISYLRPITGSKDSVEQINPRIHIKEGSYWIALGADLIPLSSMQCDLRGNDCHSIFVHKSTLYNIPHASWENLRAVKSLWRARAENAIPDLDFSGMRRFSLNRELTRPQDNSCHRTFALFCMIGVMIVLRCMFSSDRAPQ